MNTNNFSKTVIFPACAVLLSLAMTAPPAAAQDDTLRERLHEAIVESSDNKLSIVDIESTPLVDIFEVELSTGELLYVDATGEYLFAGDLYRNTPDGLLNLTATTRQEAVLRNLANVPDEEAIIFEPEGEAKATVTVFTDVDCVYCRQLHDEREQMFEYGIRLRYLAFPRGGENAESYAKMISVWCSEDRRGSLTQAKAGEDLPERECETPVLEHYRLGNLLGIQGTPALILPDGRLIPGYMEAPRLAATLGIE